MKHLLPFLAAGLVAMLSHGASARGETELARFQPGDNFPAVVENTSDSPRTTHLFDAEPVISKRRYALLGRIRYSGVKDGFLEMWSVFPAANSPEQRYFSRTKESRGPMARLTGSSDWREFMLPFDRGSTASPPPKRLEVNLILDGKGRVELDAMRLIEFDGDISSLDGGWWNSTTAAWVGGLGGGLLGTLGGVLGWMARSGRNLRLVLVLWRSLIAFGWGALALGAAALILRQPYHVWYPLLLIGGILAFVGGGALRNLRRRIMDQELRSMEARDTSAGA